VPLSLVRILLLRSLSLFCVPDNEYNNKGLIVLLTEKFKDAGYMVTEALNDADTLIVDTALVAAGSSDVTVVADDTDVLVFFFSSTTNQIWEMFSCYLKGHGQDLTNSV
jgi:hypothetical protein